MESTQAEEPEYGQADLFLSESELLEFQSLTTLLRATEKLEDQQSSFVQPVSDKSQLYRRLAEFSDLLVRHLEVAAVSASSRNRTLIKVFENTAEPDEETMAREEEGDDEPVFYTANPHLKESGNDRQTKKGTVAALLVDIEGVDKETPAIGNKTSPAAYLLSKVGSKKRKSADTTVSFQEHGENLIQLVRATYKAEGMEEVQATYDNLCNYVMLASEAKMLGRFKRGMKFAHRNIFSVLTLEINDDGNPYHAHARNVVDLEKEIPRGFLGWVLEMLSESLGLPPGLQEWEAAVAENNTIMYDKNTCHLFQLLFAAVIQETFRALEELNREKKDRFQAASDKSIDLPEAITALDNLAQRASRWLLVMSVFTGGLRKITQTHLSYLRIRFDLHTTKGPILAATLQMPDTVDANPSSTRP